VAEFKQAGTLEQVVGKGRDYFAGDPVKQASYDKITNAQVELKPHTNKPMHEEQIRNLIYQYDMPTFARPMGIPDNFLVTISDKGAGMKYTHPTNRGTNIRVMPGKPHSPLSYQQKPYVIHVKDGRALDKFGNKLSSKELPEAHIPYEEFVWRD